MRKEYLRGLLKVSKQAKARIRVETEIRLTESEEVIRRAVLNVFDADVIRIEKSGKFKVLIAESSNLRSLTKLHRLLRTQRILDAARNMLKKGCRKHILVFKLNKQAAAFGRISFVDSDAESPMGAITFTVEYEEPMEVVDWLAPPTVRGKPVWEKPMPS